jgi:hypothetical protein
MSNKDASPDAPTLVSERTMARTLKTSLPMFRALIGPWACDLKPDAIYLRAGKPLPLWLLTRADEELPGLLDAYRGALRFWRAEKRAGRPAVAAATQSPVTRAAPARRDPGPAGQPALQGSPDPEPGPDLAAADSKGARPTTPKPVN